MNPHIKSNINDVQKNITDFVKMSILVQSNPLYKEYQIKIKLCRDLAFCILLMFTLHMLFKLIFKLNDSYLEIIRIYIIATIPINIVDLILLYKQRKLVKRLKGEIK